MATRPAVWTIVAAIALASPLAVRAEDASPAAADAGTEAAWRETLATLLPRAITMLEAQQFEPFLVQLMAPDDMKRIVGDTPVAEFAKGFGEDYAGNLLAALKDAQQVTPSLDAAGLVATYPLKGKGDFSQDLAFQKVGKYWYILN